MTFRHGMSAYWSQLFLLQRLLNGAVGVLALALVAWSVFRGETSVGRYSSNTITDDSSGGGLW